MEINKTSISFGSYQILSKSIKEEIRSSSKAKTVLAMLKKMDKKGSLNNAAASFHLMIDGDCDKLVLKGIPCDTAALPSFLDCIFAGSVRKNLETFDYIAAQFPLNKGNYKFIQVDEKLTPDFIISEIKKLSEFVTTKLNAFGQIKR